MCGGVYNGHSYNMLGLTQVECFPNLDSLISAPQTSKPQEHKKTQRTTSYVPKTAFPVYMHASKNTTVSVVRLI